MSQQELLTAVVQALDSARLEYMLTGSLASSLQGEPRATHDIDVVVAMRKEAAADFAELFPPPRFHLEAEDILEAIAEHSMFNLIDTQTGDKVDFWLLTEEPFDRSRFARRRFEGFHGLKMAVSSPEDTILAKLRWAKLSGGSEKQFTDALRVYEVQFSTLDVDYLRKWAKELGIEQMLSKIEQLAEVL